MQIEFSKIATQTLRENIRFLEQAWTNREIVNFLIDIKKVVDDLEEGRYKHFQKSLGKSRSALIGKKHVRMYFRQDENKITVLLFFDVRQNPEILSDLLK